MTEITEGENMKILKLNPTTFDIHKHFLQTSGYALMDVVPGRSFIVTEPEIHIMIVKEEGR